MDQRAVDVPPIVDQLLKEKVLGAVVGRRFYRIYQSKDLKLQVKNLHSLGQNWRKIKNKKNKKLNKIRKRKKIRKNKKIKKKNENK